MLQPSPIALHLASLVYQARLRAFHAPCPVHPSELLASCVWCILESRFHHPIVLPATIMSHIPGGTFRRDAA